MPCRRWTRSWRPSGRPRRPRPPRPEAGTTNGGGTGGGRLPAPSLWTPFEDAPVIPTSGYAAFDTHGPLKPFAFDRRDPGPTDVQIDILFCGVCHSDLHTARSEWGGTTYPCVPGHEIVGRVAKAGREV